MDFHWVFAVFWAKYPLECQQCVHNSYNTLHTCHALVLRTPDESRTSATVGTRLKFWIFVVSFDKNLIAFQTKRVIDRELWSEQVFVMSVCHVHRRCPADMDGLSCLVWVCKLARSSNSERERGTALFTIIVSVFLNQVTKRNSDIHRKSGII